MTRSLVPRALIVALMIAGIGCNERRHATRRSRTRGVPAAAVTASAPAAAGTPAAASGGVVAPRPAQASAPAATPPPSSGFVANAGAKSTAAPTPTGAVAAAHPPSGAVGATPPGMAVVILMLPGAGDPAHPGKGASATSGGAPLTYKVSLGPGAENATIELAGQPPVKAPVQRVYPSPSPSVSPSSLALLRSLPTGPPSRTAASAVTGATGTGSAPYAPASPRPRRMAPASALQPSDWPADYPAAMIDPREARLSRRAIPTATRPPLSPAQIEFTSANGAPIIE